MSTHQIRIRAYIVAVPHEERPHTRNVVAEVASDTWPTARVPRAARNALAPRPYLSRRCPQ
jgi:hypothetical protein